MVFEVKSGKRKKSKPELVVIKHVSPKISWTCAEYCLRGSAKNRILDSADLSAHGCTLLLSKKSDIEVERPLSFFLSVLSQPDMAPTKKHAITTIRKRLTNFFITDTKPLYFLHKSNRSPYISTISAKSTVAAHDFRWHEYKKADFRHETPNLWFLTNFQRKIKAEILRILSK